MRLGIDCLWVKDHLPTGLCNKEEDYVGNSLVIQKTRIMSSNGIILNLISLVLEVTDQGVHGTPSEEEVEISQLTLRIT